MFVIYLQAMKKIIFINFQEFQNFLSHCITKLLYTRFPRRRVLDWWNIPIIRGVSFLFRIWLSRRCYRVFRIFYYFGFRILKISIFISQRIPLRIYMSFWEYFEPLYDYSQSHVALQCVTPWFLKQLFLNVCSSKLMRMFLV